MSDTKQVLEELRMAYSRDYVPSIMPYHTIDCAIKTIESLERENQQLKAELGVCAKAIDYNLKCVNPNSKEAWDLMVNAEQQPITQSFLK